jgi:hypothetical protein
MSHRILHDSLWSWYFSHGNWLRDSHLLWIHIEGSLSFGKYLRNFLHTRIDGIQWDHTTTDWALYHVYISTFCIYQKLEMENGRKTQYLLLERTSWCKEAKEAALYYEPKLNSVLSFGSSVWLAESLMQIVDWGSDTPPNTCCFLSGHRSRIRTWSCGRWVSTHSQWT